VKLDILFENENLVAINKPSGLLTIPDRMQSSKSLKEFLQDRYGQIFTVHRLDKDTSGLVVFAKTEAMHAHLSIQFENRLVQKKYLGLVIGQPVNESGTIDAPIMEDLQQKGRMIIHRRGKPSQTNFQVIQSSSFYSLMEFEPLTGRTHQIRVHAREIGYPLAVDPLYGDGKPVFLSGIKKKYKLSKAEESERPMIDRLALHAWKLQFTEPDGTTRLLEAPIPKEFRVLMKQIERLT
jgi:23S rRNA pseudouridine955/2504/2580 synthase/23S rRNA pseudouridine1911/1915/1917 synthase